MIFLILSKGWGSYLDVESWNTRTCEVPLLQDAIDVMFRGSAHWKYIPAYKPIRDFNSTASKAHV